MILSLRCLLITTLFSEKILEFPSDFLAVSVDHLATTSHSNTSENNIVPSENRGDLSLPSVVNFENPRYLYFDSRYRKSVRNFEDIH